jgi:O-antigen/teichoic acid export membrane protein
MDHGTPALILSLVTLSRTVRARRYNPPVANSLRVRITANLVGSVGRAALNLLGIPWLIHRIGIEAYGLISLLTTLQVAATLLDLGLAPTLTREMAVAVAQPERRRIAAQTARAIEWSYAALAVVLGLALLAASPWAPEWVRAGRLSPGSIRQAVALMAAVVAVQWPTVLYISALQGLGREVTMNRITLGGAAATWIGAVLMLDHVAPTVQVFLGWEAIIGAAQTLVLMLTFHRALPELRGARPSLAHLRGIRRFAGGMSVVTAVGLLLVNLDKVILSRLVPLDVFGYYALAGTVAAGLGVLNSPVITVLSPDFTRVAAQGDEAHLRGLYHSGSQVMALFTLPAAVVIAFFSREVILAWTGQPETAARSAILTSLLVSGAALAALAALPYRLYAAYGRTRLLLAAYGIGAAVFIPFIVALTLRYQAVGAGVACVALNAAYVVILPVLVHRRVLRGEAWRWLLGGVVLPLLACTAVAGSLKMLLPATLPGRPWLLAGLALAWALATAAAAVVMPCARKAIGASLSRLGVGPAPPAEQPA